jgi:CRISPR/Cas system-associated protein Cas10 (large subunit of type III CRISPR-Cas system)
MPDLGSLLLRSSLRSVVPGGYQCSGCHRTPLVGERLHEMDNGRRLCDLCLGLLPEEDRRAVRSERVHASERHLPVAPKAA